MPLPPSPCSKKKKIPLVFDAGDTDDVFLVFSRVCVVTLSAVKSVSSPCQVRVLLLFFDAVSETLLCMCVCVCLTPKLHDELMMMVVAFLRLSVCGSVLSRQVRVATCFPIHIQQFFLSISLPLPPSLAFRVSASSAVVLKTVCVFHSFSSPSTCTVPPR